MYEREREREKVRETERRSEARRKRLTGKQADRSRAETENKTARQTHKKTGRKKNRQTQQMEEKKREKETQTDSRPFQHSCQRPDSHSPTYLQHTIPASCSPPDRPTPPLVSSHSILGLLHKSNTHMAAPASFESLAAPATIPHPPPDPAVSQPKRKRLIHSSTSRSI